jgi:LPS-assembly protein
MKARFFLCITVLVLCHGQLRSQTLTRQFPHSEAGETGSPTGGIAVAAPHAAPTAAGTDALPDDPSQQSDIPEAQVIPAAPSGVPVRIASQTQTKRDNIYTVSGEVVIDYRDYTVRADYATYNQDTSEVEAHGHLQLDGGPDDEHILADHGTMNLDAQTGHFYSVTGTLGVRRAGTSKLIYTTPDPFAFTGREVIKDGPRKYRVIGGSMTSCRLPKPDWRLLSSQIYVNNNEASAKNSVFTLFRMPLFYLPFVTHPVDTTGRQSGLLLPIGGHDSQKGYIVGEDIYWAINRSTDLMVGTEYFSRRGWSPSAQFRYRGRGQDFFIGRFHSLLDRGLSPGNINQGGVDIAADGRRDLTAYTRSVTDIEYLSSYTYRQAFEENFALAINSEVRSQAFVSHNRDGLSENVRFERYQSFQSETSGDEIRILHLPEVQFEATDHSFGDTRLEWGFLGSAAGLSRAEPNPFNSATTARLSSGRVDFYPHLTMPLYLGGWTIRPQVAIRDTFYSRSQSGTSLAPVQRDASQNRKDFEASLELRPPPLERDFTAPWLERLLGNSKLRHTIEPEVKYSYVTGIDDFNSTLRFDQVDIASNTNEVLYSLTQRLFLKHLKTHVCAQGETPDSNGKCGAGTAQWVSWQVAQKYFFNPSFGGAVTPGTRNVLATTLDFSSIAFLTGPRYSSPVISRLRLRTSGHTDLEWDVDYDVKAGRMTSDNVYANYQKGEYFFAAGYSHLNAPEALPTRVGAAAPNSTSTNYNQLRLTGTYGSPIKKGISMGANAGYDLTLNGLQYGGIQTTYNGDCCGLSLEFRRYALGSVRNDNQFLWSFTLAGVGSGGSLRRATRILGTSLLGQPSNPAAESDDDCMECDNQ